MTSAWGDIEFAYREPIIISVGTVVSVNNSIQVQITGENFCASEACCSTWVNGRKLAPSKLLLHTHNTIQFYGSTAGGSAQIKCIDGYVSEEIGFSLESPSILATKPDVDNVTYSTAGSSNALGESQCAEGAIENRRCITVIGQYYGQDKSTVSVFVNDVRIAHDDYVFEEIDVCEGFPVPNVGCSSLSFNIPPGSGRGNLIIVKTGNFQGSLSLQKYLNYAPPVVNQVSYYPYGSSVGVTSETPSFLSEVPTRGGDRVVIQGRNFGRDNNATERGVQREARVAVYVGGFFDQGVMQGGAAARIKVNSHTEIDLELPPGYGSACASVSRTRHEFALVHHQTAP